MRTKWLFAAMVGTLGWTGMLSAQVVHPTKLSKEDAAGPIFEQPNVKTKTEHGKTVRDNIVTMSSDKKFETGMYQAGASHSEMKDRPYGVDEFMLFTSGAVTLTSLDGTVTELKAGDAVVVPAEWRGTWDTKGYTKYYVVYSRTGQGM